MVKHCPTWFSSRPTSFEDQLPVSLKDKIAYFLCFWWQGHWLYVFTQFYLKKKVCTSFIGIKNAGPSRFHWDRLWLAASLTLSMSKNNKKWLNRCPCFRRLHALQKVFIIFKNKNHASFPTSKQWKNNHAIVNKSNAHQKEQKGIDYAKYISPVFSLVLRTLVSYRIYCYCQSI